MVYLSLQHHSFTNIHMNVELKPDTEIELEVGYSFNLNYNDDNSGCIAVLKQSVKEKNNPGEFDIVVDCKGQFVCEGIVSDETKKEAHVKAYALLFPYVQSMVAHLAVEAGLPPLMLGMAKIDVDDIKLSENN